MSVSDDSDENIFDASERLVLGCESTSSIIRCVEDGTSCEILRLPSSQTGETCSVNCRVDLVIPADHQAAVSPADTDDDCKYDFQNTHLQDTTVPASSAVVEYVESSLGVDCSVANMDCDSTGHVTDSLARTDCAVKSDSCLSNTETVGMTGSSQTAESIDSRVCVNSNEPDDELLAELENEFSCMTTAQCDSVSSGYSNANVTLSSQVDQQSNDDLTLALASLQRRQQALECRLQSTLEARKQLESENAKLECKLSASLEALEAAKQDIESAKSQV